MAGKRAANRPLSTNPGSGKSMCTLLSLCCLFCGAQRLSAKRHVCAVTASVVAGCCGRASEPAPLFGGKREVACSAFLWSGLRHCCFCCCQGWVCVCVCAGNCCSYRWALLCCFSDRASFGHSARAMASAACSGACVSVAGCFAVWLESPCVALRSCECAWLCVRGFFMRVSVRVRHVGDHRLVAVVMEICLLGACSVCAARRLWQIGAVVKRGERGWGLSLEALVFVNVLLDLPS